MNVGCGEYADEDRVEENGAIPETAAFTFICVAYKEAAGDGDGEKVTLVCWGMETPTWANPEDMMDPLPAVD